MFKKLTKNILFLSLALIVLSRADCAIAQPVIDLNGDGISDFLFVKINPNNTLSWLFNVPAGQETHLADFGDNGDHLAPAAWAGAKGGLHLGLVRVASGSNKITWFIRNLQGATSQFDFGSAGDTVLAGGDFDGDGFPDAAVAKLSNNTVRWRALINPFSLGSRASRSRQFQFGGQGSRVFYAKPVAGARDWFCVIRQLAVNGRQVARWSCRNLSGSVRNGNLPRSLVTGQRPRPMPVRLASGADLMAFHFKGSGGDRIDFYNFNGRRVARRVFGTNGTLIKGDYLADQGEEVAYVGNNTATIFNPTTGNFLEVPLVTSAQVPVDEVNINQVGSNSPSPQPTPGGGGGTPPPVSGGSCKSVTPLPSTAIYKKIGSHHFTDVRRNTIGLIFVPGARGPFPSCINVQATNGTVVAKMHLYARGGGWAARYYAGIGCGSSTPFNGNAVASRARAASGNQNVLFNFGSVCYGPIDPTRCIRSRGC
ncbi:MAG TPA: hypothetical protein PKD37_06340 [Oligoflexia bacterium]|nr:hypothetical protein [Oligoflexia bacterium]HMP27580.1 hypothetical protein [Oligoflexia bacterium]